MHTSIQINAQTDDGPGCCDDEYCNGLDCGSFCCVCFWSTVIGSSFSFLFGYMIYSLVKISL